MNTENSKTNESNKFNYQFTDKRNVYDTNKFKIYAPTSNDGFDLPDGSYPISDIQDHFEFIIKKMKC